MSLLQSVKKYLTSIFFYTVDEWLSGYVEYLSQNTENNYSEPEIQNFAREQWLLNDLCEICPGSLPDNLQRQAKTTLTGCFVLQINKAIDIGTPAYQQYLKIQKVNTENVEATALPSEDKITHHRMMKLYLTDGVQNIQGIEYRPMRNLGSDITPGCKILIKGPVECRSGMLLLTETSVELLGGEVKEIAESYSLPALLASKLGITHVQDVGGNVLHTPRNTDIPAPHAAMPSFTATTHDDEDILEATIEAENAFKRLRSNSPPANPEKKQKTDETVISTNMEDDYPTYEDMYDHEDEELLRAIESQFVNAVAPNARERSFVDIKQLNALPVVERAGKAFKVKARIQKLLSKLLVGKDGWSLKCTLIDDTGSIDVEFASDVLERLVGYSPAEMNALKKEISSKPEIKARLSEALEKTRQTLKVLHCMLELTMLDPPRITALEYG